jgi:hypothetical protein
MQTRLIHDSRPGIGSQLVLGLVSFYFRIKKGPYTLVG